MPCYDPPPEWYGDAQRSAEQAVKILCAMVGNAPNYTLVPSPVLRWYHAHRQIDLCVAQDPRNSYTPEDIQAIKADIDVIEFALQEQLKQRTQ